MPRFVFQFAYYEPHAHALNKSPISSSEDPMDALLASESLGGDDECSAALVVESSSIEEARLWAKHVARGFAKKVIGEEPIYSDIFDERELHENETIEHLLVRSGEEPDYSAWVEEFRGVESVGQKRLVAKRQQSQSGDFSAQKEPDSSGHRGWLARLRDIFR